MVSLAGILLGKRNAGILSWGSLVPGYFLFMLLIFPSINYVTDVYKFYTVIPSEFDIVRLYLLCALGMVSFSTSYVLTGLGPTLGALRDKSEKFSRFVLSVFSHKLSVLLLLVLILIGTLWSMGYGYFGLTNRDSADIDSGAGVMGIISSFLPYANIILWSIFFQKEEKDRSLALPATTLVLSLLLALFANSKGALLFPLVHVMLAYFFIKKRVPISGIAGLAIFFFTVVFPIVQGFRYAVYFTLTNQTALSVFPALIDYVTGLSWLDPTATREGESALSLGRGLFPYLAYIFKQAGGAVPFLDGKTYAEGLENMIPRFFLPDKVDMSTGHWTGQLFDHVLPSDPITNVSPSYMGEFYMNNGIFGLVVGMALLGVFARLIDECVFKASGNWLKVLFVLNILWLEAFIGTTILVFIKTFLTFVVCVYLLSVFGKRVSAR